MNINIVLLGHRRILETYYGRDYEKRGDKEPANPIYAYPLNEVPRVLNMALIASEIVAWRKSDVTPGMVDSIKERIVQWSLRPSRKGLKEVRKVKRGETRTLHYRCTTPPCVLRQWAREDGY